jgi:hypothetical protein
MRVLEMQEFSEIRTKARAYLCYLMERHLPNRHTGITLEEIEKNLRALTAEIGKIDASYILDPTGRQVADTVSTDPRFARQGKDEKRDNRAYYYRILQEKRCVLTDPYPSIGSNTLVVTASYPIYDEHNELLYIVCVDISLTNILSMFHPSSLDSLSGKASKWIYTAFSAALFMVALLFFVKAIESFITYGIQIDHITVKNMFESTILLTLSLAVFDLVKAIFEEEVLGHHKRRHPEEDMHKTMVRFLGSIIIALAIEALMLVFKFAITDPTKLLYAVGLLIGITALMIGLSIYLKTIDHNRRP